MRSNVRKRRRGARPLAAARAAYDRGVSGPGEASEIFARGMLDGRAALVTGGGTGLGRATALELARCGASVTIAGRREDVLEEAAEEIAQLTGQTVHAVAETSASPPTRAGLSRSRSSGWARWTRW